MTRGCAQSGLAAGSGSTSNTSRPAPATCPLSSAAASAASSTSAPRPTLTTRAPRREEREPPRVEQVARLGGEREREHEPLDAREERVEAREGPGLARLVAVRRAAHADDVHPERLREARDLEADRAEAEHREPAPLQVLDVARVPAPRGLVAAPAREVAREREQVEHDRVGDRHGGGARGRRDAHAAGEEALEERVVDAGREDCGASAARAPGGARGRGTERRPGRGRRRRTPPRRRRRRRRGSRRAGPRAGARARPPAARRRSAPRSTPTRESHPPCRGPTISGPRPLDTRAGGQAARRGRREPAAGGRTMDPFRGRVAVITGGAGRHRRGAGARLRGARREARARGPRRGGARARGEGAPRARRGGARRSRPT